MWTPFVAALSTESDRPGYLGLRVWHSWLWPGAPRLAVSSGSSDSRGVVLQISFRRVRTTLERSRSDQLLQRLFALTSSHRRFCLVVQQLRLRICPGIVELILTHMQTAPHGNVAYPNYALLTRQLSTSVGPVTIGLSVL